MQCRPGCAACCIIPSISSAIPGMPQGKPAGVRCIQLDTRGYCMIFASPLRPRVCRNFRPTLETCGKNTDEAVELLRLLESSTMPD
ncbi:MAG: YkgJ family cysteine cluster protein [Trichlorobacter sp.]